MKKNEMVKAAQDLLNQSNQLGVIEKLIELIEYSRVAGDKFAVDNFLQMDTLDLINENISSIREILVQVSNSIYPKSEDN